MATMMKIPKMSAIRVLDSGSGADVALDVDIVD
jgi:hypothetical protein